MGSMLDTIWVACLSSTSTRIPAVLAPLSRTFLVVISSSSHRHAMPPILLFPCALPAYVPPGRYSDVQGATTSSCVGSSAAGYYCPAGSTNDSAMPCTAGYSCPAGSSVGTASLCPAGQYSLTGAAVCSPCPAGVYGFAPGSSSATCSGTWPMPHTVAVSHDLNARHRSNTLGALMGRLGTPHRVCSTSAPPSRLCAAHPTR